jgi:hypothetical protein
VFEATQPDFLITILTSGIAPQATPAYLARLSADFASAKILVGGKALMKAKGESLTNISRFDNALMLKELLNE